MDRFQIGDVIRFDQDDREGIGIIEGVNPCMRSFYAVRVTDSYFAGIKDEWQSLHTCDGFFVDPHVGWNVNPENIIEVLESAGKPMTDVDVGALLEVLGCD